MLWILVVVYFQSMGDYWIRHIRPDLMPEFTEAIDARVVTLFQTCTGMDVSAWSTFARERIRLLIWLKGCGLRWAADRRSG